MKQLISIPNAYRTFQALRSLGYDINSSIADLVDNSITSYVRSKNVEITIYPNYNNDVVCRIVDDGVGMSEDELIEAMRLGTDSEYVDSDLGKFGMGMKTASLAHCNVLTVISKRKDSKAFAYRWDLNAIEKTDDWNIFKLSDNEIKLYLQHENITLESSGTVVFWDELFEINRTYKSYKSAKLANNYLSRLTHNLRLHLSITYHKIISCRIELSISVNGEKIDYWDPFCRNESQSEPIDFPRSFAELVIKDYETPIKFEAYVLPSREQFSSEAAWKSAKGTKSWNDSQGYYIYRANRLIHYGGWYGTKAKDEHDKLARVSIDIDPSLDSLFAINVNKSRVSFPEELLKHLKDRVNPKVVKIAKAKYRKTGKDLIVKNTFRNSPTAVNLVRSTISKHNISARADNNDNVLVTNRKGKFVMNHISEFAKYSATKDFELISEHLDSPDLYKVIGDFDGKFKVVVNASHKFYSSLYAPSVAAKSTAAIDSLIFSLALAELYCRNGANEEFFLDYKNATVEILNLIIESKLS